MRMALSPSRPWISLLPLGPLLMACSPAAPIETRVPTGPGTASASATAEAPAPRKPTQGSVVAAEVPAKLVIDGDLGEWGSSSESSPAPKKEGGGEAAAPSNDHLAIALGPSGATIAAEVTAEMGDGFVMSLALDPPDVPSIGYMMRGGGVMPLPCMMDDEQSASDEMAECKALVAAHEKFSDAYLARFRAHYRVDRQGISILTGGAWTPVAGAKVAARPRGKGFSLEASLPSKSLPRTVQAPVERLQARMDSLDGTKVPVPQMEEWSPLLLPEPVGFEPHADLRALVFAAAHEREIYGKAFSISYQPGDDLDLEDVNYQGGTTQVGSEHEILYSKQATLGDLEVGYAYRGTPHGGGEWVTVIALVKGKPVGHVFMAGTAQGIVERDGELHIFTHLLQTNDSGPGESHDWSVVAVDKEGHFNEDVMDPLQGIMGWMTAIPLSSADFSMFSIDGTTLTTNDEPGTNLEALWKYDKKKRRYVLKMKEMKKNEVATLLKDTPSKKPAAADKGPAKKR